MKDNNTSVRAKSRSLRAGLASATILSSLAGGAWAQDVAPANPEQDNVIATAPQSDAAINEVDEIVVTGFRGSLQRSTQQKRQAVAFTDSINAEDIGKLPNQNLAESLLRIPGIQLRRNTNGEGLQVSVRGLGPSFTRVLLNGSQIDVASDGGSEGGSSNRELDLDLFPSELFNRLDVYKSPQASVLEGGIAGVINLRNARPFDRPGQHFDVQTQGSWSETNGEINPRGAVIYSRTWDNFGVLVGLAGVKGKSRTDGWDSLGWTDANISCAGCNAGLGTGNGFSYATIVPPNTGYGLTPGTPVDLEATSGLTLQQLSQALLPRLARHSLTLGERERLSGVVALQYRPSDTLEFNLDILAGKSSSEAGRSNLNWYVRSSGDSTTGGMVPIDIEVDENNVVTRGTFANSQLFAENDIRNQDLNFYNINPSVMWQPRDWLRIDAQANYSRSVFNREQPSFLFNTPFQGGIVVEYENPGEPTPVITPNVDLADPNLGWIWYRVNMLKARRVTSTRGGHLDVTVGENPDINFKFGLAYDQTERHITAYDNSAAWQDFVCGAACAGLAGTAVPNADLPQYFLPFPVNDYGKLRSGDLGYSAWIWPNFDKLKEATNYDEFARSAPIAKSGLAGANTGDVVEKTSGAYGEVNGITEIMGRELHFNAGARYFKTEQNVAGPVQINGVLSFQETNASYDDILPSMNLAYDMTDNIKLRVAASKTITRANPTSLLPGTTFSDPSAQTASQGNSELSPYTSDNIDMGGEYYTGGAGYFGVALFRKNVRGFTTTQQVQQPFSSLGIPYSALSFTQQQAIDLRGGPDLAQVTVNKQVNINGLLEIKGVELTWSQPLDFIVHGLGFVANGTHITQDVEGGVTLATGIAPYTYNLTGYYEDHGVSVRLTYVWNDKMVTGNAPQMGINLRSYTPARGQLDLSASYQLPVSLGEPRLTLDVLNITNEPMRNIFGYDNVTSNLWDPGRTVMVGLRTSF